jgi:signal transduction histidine kinase
LGIGLFQCKQIIEGHRGRIEVESEEGKGSTFRVMMPVTYEAGK